MVLGVLIFSRGVELAGASRVYWVDSHRYLTSAIAIQRADRIQQPPSITWLNFDHYFDWPLLKVYAVILSDITGLSLDILRYVIPIAFLCFTFLFLWFGFRQFTDETPAFIAAVMIVMLDPFYRFFLQFHGQNMGVMFFALFLGALIAGHRAHWSVAVNRFDILILIIGSAFTLTHRFSILVAAITLLGALIASPMLRTVAPKLRLGSGVGYAVPRLAIPLGVLMLAYVLYQGGDFLSWGVSQIFVSSPSGDIQAGKRGGVAAVIPSALKVVVALLATAGAWVTVRRFAPSRPWLILSASFGGFSVPMVVLKSPSRIILFAFVLLGGLSAVIFNRLETSNIPLARVAVGGLVVVMGVLGGIAGPIPNFVDDDPTVNSPHFDNQQVITDQSPAMGEFISQYELKAVKTDLWAKIPATRYGGVSLSVAEGVTSDPPSYYAYDHARSPSRGGDQIYSNGRLIIEQI